MKTISRYIMTLALLLTAVTGAWADWTGGTYTATTNEELGAINVSDDATLTINQGVTVTVNGGITVASGKTLTVTGGGTLVANGANGGNGDTNQPGNAGGTAIAGNVIINGVGLTVTATGGQGGQGGKGYDGDNGFGDGAGGQGDQGSTGGNGGYAFSGEVTIYAGSVKANGGTGGQGGKGGTGGTGGDGDMFDTGAYGGNGGTGGTGGYGGYAFAGTLTVFGGNVTAYGGAGGAGGAGGDGGDGGQGDVDPGESGEPGDVGNDGGQSNAYANNMTFQTATYTMTDGTNPITDATGKNTVVITAADTTDPSDFEVTINDTKTEASFEMPQYDVTATYTIKRDLTVDVTAQVGDGTQEQPRYRVKKDGNNKFIPADMEMAAVPALFTVNDGIEQKALTQTQDYIVQIYAIDAEGQPTGDPMTFATFTFEPGIYAVKAVAADGSDYAGETALSNTFKLFQGYEVEVAAKEFITYYKDEPLYADTETSADAVIYTIQSVSADQATLSAAIETAPSLTPLLIFNNSDQAKTFLLIPANEEPNLQLTVAPEFVGTLTGTTIAASTEDQTNYAFNGKAFVFVKDAIEVGANKAWLSVNTGEPSARITIVFDSETTKIANTNLTNITNGDWYDLNGRKLQNIPTKKGVYIFNGRKVVIK